MPEQRGGGRFPGSAGNAHQREAVRRIAIKRRGNPRQRFARIGGHQRRDALRHHGGILHQQRGGAGSEHLGNELVPMHPRAGQTGKEIARLHLARVITNPADINLWVAEHRGGNMC